MSDEMDKAADPVRFVPTEAVPTYPRKNIRLGDVPVGHLVEFANTLQYVWNHKRGPELITLLDYTANVGIPWPKGHVVTDHGPVEKIAPDGKGGWDHTMSPPATAPTVKLIDAKSLQVVRFTDGNVGVRLAWSEEASGGVLVVFVDRERWMPSNALVTVIGSIQIGGAT